MAALAQSLSDEDMVNIAVFYAAQPRPPAKPSEGATDSAQRLVKLGDGTRLIPSCASCHGSRGGGNKHGIPALAGQNAVYFKQAMQGYAAGTRANDVYSVMRSISKQLTAEEIDQLAAYYAGLE